MDLANRIYATATHIDNQAERHASDVKFWRIAQFTLLEQAESEERVSNWLASEHRRIIRRIRKNEKQARKLKRQAVRLLRKYHTAAHKEEYHE